MSAHTNLFIDKRIPTSKAFLALTSPAAIRVLFVFFTKRQVAKLDMKRGRQQYAVTNNGEIVFTYEEAKAKLGITGSTFNRALDQLVAVGFVDIARTGMGVHKVTTLYSLPDRWVKYGTPEFKPKKRAKASNLGVGFKKGNTLW